MTSFFQYFKLPVVDISVPYLCRIVSPKVTTAWILDRIALPMALESAAESSFEEMLQQQAIVFAQKLNLEGSLIISECDVVRKPGGYFTAVNVDKAIAISNGTLTGKVSSNVWEKIKSFQQTTLNQQDVFDRKVASVMEFNILDDSGVFRRTIAFAPVTNEPIPSNPWLATIQA